MKRLFYLLALFCAVGIGGYRIVQQNIQLKNHEERIFKLRTGNGMGTGVYAIRDIKVGEMVTTTDIETRPIAVNKMPDHMICRVDEVIGHRPIYGIEKGQLLSIFDFRTQRELLGDGWDAKPIEGDGK